MMMRLIFAAVFTLLTFEDSSALGHGYCNLTPQKGFNPTGITGRWYGVKLTVPTYLCPLPITDATWDVSVNPKTGVIHITVGGRYEQFPYGCASFPAVLTPLGAPGVYHRRAKEIIYEIDQVVTHTDYHNYLVVAGCIPKFYKGCESNVLTFTRTPYTGDVKLSKFLDNIISTQLCIDPKRLTFFNKSPLGPATCSAHGKVYKK